MYRNGNSLTYSQAKVTSVNIFLLQKFIVMFTLNRKCKVHFSYMLVIDVYMLWYSVTIIFCTVVNEKVSSCT